MQAPLTYIVFVDGRESGQMEVDFVPAPNGFMVRSSVTIRLAALIITTYHYEQVGHEYWQEGRLDAFEYVTQEDGALTRVSARREGNGFVVDGPSGCYGPLTGTAAPSFWNVDIINYTTVIDPQTGAVIPFTIEPLPCTGIRMWDQVVEARGYAFNSYINGQIWFDQEQRSLAFMFEKDGYQVEVIRTP